MKAFWVPFFCLLLRHIGRLLPRHAGTYLLVKGRKKIERVQQTFQSHYCRLSCSQLHARVDIRKGNKVLVLMFLPFGMVQALYYQTNLIHVSCLLAFKAAIDVLIQLHLSYFVIAVVKTTISLCVSYHLHKVNVNLFQT